MIAHDDRVVDEALELFMHAGGALDWKMMSVDSQQQ